MLKLRINPIVAKELKNIRDYIAEDNEEYVAKTIKEIWVSKVIWGFSKVIWGLDLGDIRKLQSYLGAGVGGSPDKKRILVMMRIGKKCRSSTS